MTALHDAARLWTQLGYSVLPVASDGSKRPAVSWTPYQTVHATAEEIDLWFQPDGDGRTWHANSKGRLIPEQHGLGVICGAVSGHLEMLEWEGRAVTEGLLFATGEAMAAAGELELWQQVTAGGYVERTPSSGIHLYYRISDGPARPNTKLARRPSTPEELEQNPAQKLQVEIETRGEGGYSALAPTPGTHHPSGNPWVAIIGSPATIPTITSEQRDILYAVASTLDQMPAQAEPAAPRIPGAPTGVPTGVRPGDDYNNRAEWRDILTGWTCIKRLGTGYGWKRPGKTDPGISATTGTASDGVDRLYVFSSSTDFECEIPYSKFAAYTLLHYGGDYKAAARKLGSQGFGERTPPPKPTPKPAKTTKPHLAAVPATPDTATGTDTPPPPPPVDGNTALNPEPDDEDDDGEYRLSDNGNARALIEHHGDHIRYCYDIGRWLHWDGVRWHRQPTNGGYIRELAKTVAYALPGHAEGHTPADKWKKVALSAKGVSDTLTQACTDPRIAICQDQLDSHPELLGTPGGVVDLRTGQLSPPDPALLITRITASTPDDNADLGVWLNFLTTTFGADQELIDYLQLLVGYSTTGNVSKHVLPFAHGSGGNGKGVFLEGITGVLGDYATTAPNAFLMARNFAPHETEIARLAGARFVLCSEVNDTDKFDEAKVKQLTGGDTLTARFMRQDHFSFAPSHHLWLMGNYRPAVTAGGRSFWRRCRLIPFGHEVPDALQIDDFQGIMIRDHGPAILAWAIRGAQRFLTEGLTEPESVMVATADYAHDQDTVGRFVEEMCHRAPGSALVKILVRDMFSAYDSWCSEAGETPVSAKRFTQDLQQRFEAASTRANGKRFYTGITLLSIDSDGSGTGTADGDGSWYR